MSTGTLNGIVRTRSMNRQSATRYDNSGFKPEEKADTLRPLRITKHKTTQTTHLFIYKLTDDSEKNGPAWPIIGSLETDIDSLSRWC